MKKFSYCFYLISIFFFATGCENLADAFFSEKDDVAMGQSFDKEVRGGKSEFQIYKNPELTAYVQGIVDRVKKSPKIKRKSIYPYRVALLQDEETINAFCTPGGFIYVTTGLLQFIENEATLAGILAHEIAHAEKRHARQRMLSQLGVQILLSLLLGGNENPWIEMGAKIGGGLAILHNSRGDEMEADEAGFTYLQDTPYYVGGISYFFEKISKERQGNQFLKKLEGLVSTHPIPEDRIKANTERLKKKKVKLPTENNLFTKRYLEKVRTLSITQDTEPFD